MKGRSINTTIAVKNEVEGVAKNAEQTLPQTAWKM